MRPRHRPLGPLRPRRRGPRRPSRRLRTRPRRGSRTPPDRPPPHDLPGCTRARRDTAEGRLVGFVYGMPNDRTHWWSTVVEPYLRAIGHEHWLDDSFVITELHVHPGHQNHGVGRALITTITDSAPEPRSILSAIDIDSPARGLYRSLGYAGPGPPGPLPQRPQAVRGDGRPPAAAPQVAAVPPRPSPPDFHGPRAARLTSCHHPPHSRPRSSGDPHRQEYENHGQRTGPAHVPVDGEDAARRPGGRRGAQPQAARPRRLRPPHRRRRVDLAAARQEGPRQRGADRPRGDGRDRRPGGAAPRPAAEGAVRGDRPLGRVRPRAVPPEGPQGRRLPPRPDPRGDLHPAGEGPGVLLQGPAGDPLPDPDQVP